MFESFLFHLWYNKAKLERAPPEISGETVAEYKRLVKDDIKHLKDIFSKASILLMCCMNNI